MPPDRKLPTSFSPLQSSSSDFPTDDSPLMVTDMCSTTETTLLHTESFPSFLTGAYLSSKAFGLLLQSAIREHCKSLPSVPSLKNLRMRIDVTMESGSCPTVQVWTQI